MNKLYVLMGYPGSGKTSFLKDINLKSTDLVLSSDDLRLELFGFYDQEHNKELFDELYKRAENHKDKGNVYIDSTCLSRKDRMRLFNRLRKFYSLDLICILRPIDEIIQTNNLRLQNDKDKYISEDILKKILGRFQLPTYEEGWHQISFIINTSKSSLEEVLFNYKSLEDKPHDNPHHPETIKEHIDNCIDFCRYHELMPEMLTLAFYHDLGKFYVQQYNKEKGYSQTIGHAAVSAYVYLIDASVRYLLDYNDQHNITENTLNRFFDIYKMSNISDILTMYYLIYYHDQPYACESKSHLKLSLSKPSKCLTYLEDEGYISIIVIVELLIGFNKIDSLRPEN